MTLDLWTVFAAVVLPYAPYLAVAAHKRRRGIYDPAAPRDSNAMLEGWASRAKGAELNSFEALAAYLTVTFIAYQVGADVQILGWIGVAWVASRLAYIGAYTAGYGRARGILWTVGLLLLVARFVVALIT